MHHKTPLVAEFTVDQAVYSRFHIPYKEPYSWFPSRHAFSLCFFLPLPPCDTVANLV